MQTSRTNYMHRGTKGANELLYLTYTRRKIHSMVALYLSGRHVVRMQTMMATSRVVCKVFYLAL